MPTEFARPTRAQILARVQSDIEGELQGVSAKLRRRPEHAHARGITGVSDAAHGHIAWAAEQILPDQAVERYLLRWADLYGLTRLVANRAQGSLLFTGTGSVPAGTELVRVQDGLAVTVDAIAAVSGPTAVPVTAVLGGLAGNLVIGESLQFVSAAPAGIDAVATVQATFTGGTELESPEDLLTRLLRRIQQPPLGGAPGDHVAWALEVPGTKRAWEYKGTDGIGNPGLGKIAVTFVLDMGDVASDVIIPDTVQVNDMQEYLDARSPAEVIVFALTSLPLVLQIDLGDNDTPQIQDAVCAEIQQMLLDDASPGPSVIYKSRISAAISAATGEVSHTLNLPASDVAVSFGQISTYTVPTFV